MKSRLVWIIWAMLLSAYFFTLIVLMGGANESLKQASVNPEQVKPLDLYMGGFTEADLSYQLENMGEEGRKVYLGIETGEDFIYPMVYAAFLGFTLFFLARFLFASHWPKRILLWPPILAMVFDMMENHHLVMILQQYPDYKLENVLAASMANQVKWTLALGSFGLVILLGLWALGKKLSQR